MADRTAEQALDARIERTHRAISCLVDAVVFGSGSTLTQLHTLSIYATGQERPNRIRLTTHGGRGQLFVHLAERYRIETVEHAVPRALYRIATSFYIYQILDLGGQEIVAYHWHPEERSTVIRPHVHVAAAAPIILAQPSGSPLEEMKTYLGKLHLPTGHIGIEDVVELLIADFNADPRRADWREVIDAGRAM